MARVQSVQSSFSEGQISPRLQGYVDLPAYEAAAKELKNFTVLPQGSATKRSGTYYAAETKSSGEARLIPFTVGQGQAYVLEMGHLYFRVYSQDLRLNYHDSSTDYASTDIYEVTTTYESTQVDDLHYTQSADVLFIVHPDHKPRKIVRTIIEGTVSTTNRAEDGSIWTLSDLTFEDGPYAEINTTLTSIITLSGTDKFETTDIGDFYVDGTLNQLVRKNHGLLDGQTIWVRDIGAATITFLPASSTSGDSDIATVNHKKYFVVNSSANSIQITTSLTSGIPDAYSTLDGGSSTDVRVNVHKQTFKEGTEGVTITASGTGNTPFAGDSSDIGKTIRINPLPGSQIKWGWIEITAGSSSTVATGEIKKEIVSDNASYEWQISVWDSTNGFPRTVALYQQRLVFAGTKQYPATIWFSNSGDFYNFAISELIGIATGNFDSTGANIVGEQILDTNAVVLTIDSDTVDQVEWLKEGKKLTMGTSGGIFSLYGSENDLTITPFNFTIQKVADWETETEALPVGIGNVVMYVQKNGRKIRELTYEAEKENFQAIDITLRAEDITFSGIKELVYQDSPYGVMWCRLTNGKLIACTYNKNLNLYAWSTHILAGSHTDPTYDSHAKVERITSIPRGTHDQMWFVAKRSIDLGVVTADASTEKLALTAHGMANGTRVRFITTASDLPSGLSIDTDYYVISTATNDFKVSTESGGSAVNITDTGTGTHTVQMMDRRYVEYMIPFYDNQETIQESAHFIDSGLYKESSNTDAVTSTARKFNGSSGINVGTNVITASAAHGLSIGDAVTLSTTGTLPTGMTAAITYIVETVPATTTLTLAEDVTEAGGFGTSIDVTAVGSDNDVFITKIGYKYIGGLSHLAGETVSILGDGALQPERTVSITGTVGLYTVCSTYARVGLQYTSTLTTLPRVNGPGDTYAVTGTKRLLTVNFLFLQTLGLSYGMEGLTMDEILFRESEDFVYGTKVPLFTGVKELSPTDRSFSAEGVTLESVHPFPATVLRIAFEYEVNI